MGGENCVSKELSMGEKEDERQSRGLKKCGEEKR